MRLHVGLHPLTVHDANRPTWIYRTEGLRQFGHQELIFATVRTTVEAPDGPIVFMRTIARVTAQGGRVTVGGYTELGIGGGRAGLLGRPGFLAVGYAVSHSMAHVLPPDAPPEHDHLAVVTLTPDENAVHRRYGLARVLAWLGRDSRFYPYPLWNAPDRTSVVPVGADETILAKCGVRADFAGCAPTMEGGRVRLTVSAEGANTLADALSAAMTRGMALFVPTSAGWSGAAHCLVWQPGSASPAAITRTGGPDRFVAPDASRDAMLGCFVAFVVGMQDGTGAKLVEDGFVVPLAKPSADQLVAQLRSGIGSTFTGSTDLMPFETRIADA